MCVAKTMIWQCKHFFILWVTNQEAIIHENNQAKKDNAEETPTTVTNFRPKT